MPEWDKLYVLPVNLMTVFAECSISLLHIVSFDTVFVHLGDIIILWLCETECKGLITTRGVVEL